MRGGQSQSLRRRHVRRVDYMNPTLQRDCTDMLPSGVDMPTARRFPGSTSRTILAVEQAHTRGVYLPESWSGEKVTDIVASALALDTLIENVVADVASTSHLGDELLGRRLDENDIKAINAEIDSSNQENVLLQATVAWRENPFAAVDEFFEDTTVLPRAEAYLAYYVLKAAPPTAETPRDTSLLAALIVYVLSLSPNEARAFVDARADPPERYRKHPLSLRRILRAVLGAVAENPVYPSLEIFDAARNLRPRTGFFRPPYDSVAVNDDSLLGRRLRAAYGEFAARTLSTFDSGIFPDNYVIPAIVDVDSMTVHGIPYAFFDEDESESRWLGFSEYEALGIFDLNNDDSVGFGAHEEEKDAPDDADVVGIDNNERVTVYRSKEALAADGHFADVRYRYPVKKVTGTVSLYRSEYNFSTLLYPDQARDHDLELYGDWGKPWREDLDRFVAAVVGPIAIAAKRQRTGARTGVDMTAARYITDSMSHVILQLNDFISGMPGSGDVSVRTNTIDSFTAFVINDLELALAALPETVPARRALEWKSMSRETLVALADVFLRSTSLREDRDGVLRKPVDDETMTYAEAYYAYLLRSLGTDEDWKTLLSDAVMASRPQLVAESIRAYLARHPDFEPRSIIAIPYALAAMREAIDFNGQLDATLYEDAYNDLDEEDAVIWTTLLVTPATIVQIFVDYDVDFGIDVLWPEMEWPATQAIYKTWYENPPPPSQKRQRTNAAYSSFAVRLLARSGVGERLALAISAMNADGAQAPAGSAYLTLDTFLAIYAPYDEVEGAVVDIERVFHELAVSESRALQQFLAWRYTIGASLLDAATSTDALNQDRFPFDGPNALPHVLNFAAALIEDDPRRGRMVGKLPYNVRNTLFSVLRDDDLDDATAARIRRHPFWRLAAAHGFLDEPTYLYSLGVYAGREDVLRAALELRGVHEGDYYPVMYTMRQIERGITRARADAIDDEPQYAATAYIVLTQPLNLPRVRAALANRAIALSHRTLTKLLTLLLSVEPLPERALFETIIARGAVWNIGSADDTGPAGVAPFLRPAQLLLSLGTRPREEYKLDLSTFYDAERDNLTEPLRQFLDAGWYSIAVPNELAKLDAQATVVASGARDTIPVGAVFMALDADAETTTTTTSTAVSRARREDFPNGVVGASPASAVAAAYLAFNALLEPAAFDDVSAVIAESDVLRAFFGEWAAEPETAIDYEQLGRYGGGSRPFGFESVLRYAHSLFDDDSDADRHVRFALELLVAYTRLDGADDFFAGGTRRLDAERAALVHTVLPSDDTRVIRLLIGAAQFDTELFVTQAFRDALSGGYGTPSVEALKYLTSFVLDFDVLDEEAYKAAYTRFTDNEAFRQQLVLLRARRGRWFVEESYTLSAAVYYLGQAVLYGEAEDPDDAEAAFNEALALVDEPAHRPSTMSSWSFEEIEWLLGRALVGRARLETDWGDAEKVIRALLQRVPQVFTSFNADVREERYPLDDTTRYAERYTVSTEDLDLEQEFDELLHYACSSPTVLPTTVIERLTPMSVRRADGEPPRIFRIVTPTLEAYESDDETNRELRETIQDELFGSQSFVVELLRDGGYYDGYLPPDYARAHYEGIVFFRPDTLQFTPEERAQPRETTAADVIDEFIQRVDELRDRSGYYGSAYLDWVGCDPTALPPWIEARLAALGAEKEEGTAAKRLRTRAILSSLKSSRSVQSGGLLVPDAGAPTSLPTRAALNLDVFINFNIENVDTELLVAPVRQLKDEEVAKINNVIAREGDAVLRQVLQWRTDPLRVVFYFFRGDQLVPRAEAYLSYYIVERIDPNRRLTVPFQVPASNASIRNALTMYTLSLSSAELATFLEGLSPVYRRMSRALVQASRPESDKDFFTSLRGIAPDSLYFRPPYNDVAQDDPSLLGRRLRAAYGEFGAFMLSNVNFDAPDNPQQAEELTTTAELGSWRYWLHLSPEMRSVTIGNLRIGEFDVYINSERDDVDSDDEEFEQFVWDARFPELEEFIDLADDRVTDARIYMYPRYFDFALLYGEAPFRRWRRRLDAFVSNVVGPVEHYQAGQALAKSSRNHSVDQLVLARMTAAAASPNADAAPAVAP